MSACHLRVFVLADFVKLNQMLTISGILYILLRAIWWPKTRLLVYPTYKQCSGDRNPTV